MTSILQDLFYGSLCPQEGLQDLSQSLKYFHDHLMTEAPELEKKFDVLRSDVLHAYQDDTEQMFYQGFGLAVKLFAEALSQ